MIRFIDVSFEYPEGPVFTNVDLALPGGSVTLIHGRTGSGKSTLLQLVNRLAPNFTGGIASGKLEIDGVDYSDSKPHHLAHLVGYVGQRPESSFVAETVADELAFGMEQLGLPREQIRERVHTNAARFGLEKLLEHNPSELSAGEQQRVAIAAALNNEQRVLLLDEPTSALDDFATHALLGILTELKSAGVTILLAEHHVDRVLAICDTFVHVASGKASISTKPRVQKLRPIKPAGVGSIKVLLGPNGSGKTTRLWGLQKATYATMVPQRASDLLYLNSVAEELSESDEFHKLEPGTTGRLLDELVPNINRDLNPRDLSVGSQLALAIAVQLAGPADALLLDEPTRGFDLEAKQYLVNLLGQLRAAGREITLATHDPEFAKAVADEVEVLA